MMIQWYYKTLGKYKVLNNNVDRNTQMYLNRNAKYNYSKFSENGVLLNGNHIK